MPASFLFKGRRSRPKWAPK